jgi:hypothetical protein
MKEYLSKINQIGKHLKNCASWNTSKKSISNINSGSDSEKDYVYEFFCYLTILNDLTVNYDLIYYPGAGSTMDIFPRNPANKEGVPFFFITNKKTNDKFQVCAGTFIKSQISRFRAPDISFQLEGSHLSDPQYTDVKMIYDTKRKRPTTKNQKLSDSQYSGFTVMIKELNLENAALEDLSLISFRNLMEIA